MRLANFLPSPLPSPARPPPSICLPSFFYFLASFCLSLAGSRKRRARSSVCSTKFRRKQLIYPRMNDPFGHFLSPFCGGRETKEHGWKFQICKNASVKAKILLFPFEPVFCSVRHESCCIYEYRRSRLQCHRLLWHFWHIPNDWFVTKLPLLMVTVG